MQGPTKSGRVFGLAVAMIWLFVLVEFPIVELVDGPDERVVLRGQPSTVTSCSKSGCKHESLSEAEGREAQVLIVERDGKYIWASREGRELHHTVSGMFHLFIDLQGGGYVKVLDQRNTPKDALTRFQGAEVQYYEHLTITLSPMIYWGEAASFDVYGR